MDLGKKCALLPRWINVGSLVKGPGHLCIRSSAQSLPRTGSTSLSRTIARSAKARRPAALASDGLFTLVSAWLFRGQRFQARRGTYPTFGSRCSKTNRCSPPGCCSGFRCQQRRESCRFCGLKTEAPTPGWSRFRSLRRSSPESTHQRLLTKMSQIGHSEECLHFGSVMRDPGSIPIQEGPTFRSTPRWPCRFLPRRAFTQCRALSRSPWQ